MRISIAIISILVLDCFTGHSQTSYDYTMAIYNKVSAFNSAMNTKYKDTFLVKRIETGVLSPEGNGQNGSSNRKLFAGNEYIIIAFTDARISDYTLRLYRENSDKKWEAMDTRANDITISTNDLIGHVKIASVKPVEDGLYKFEIAAPIQNNVLGRYGIMIWSKDDDSIVDRSVTYTIDNYSISNFDSATNKYGDFSKDVAYSCEFIIDAGQTTITHKEPSGAVSTYSILQKDDTGADWTIYYIQSANGKKLDFMIPKNGKAYIRVTLSGPGDNPLTDYHILRQ
jgi:hypothetical protein